MGVLYGAGELDSDLLLHHLAWIELLVFTCKGQCSSGDDVTDP